MPRYEIDWEAFALLTPEEQQEAIVELNEMVAGTEANPLLFFEPYPKQAEFLASRKRFKWMLGGNRAGKTTTCTVDDIIQLVPEEDLPEHLRRFKKWHPPFHLRVIGQNEDQLLTVVIKAFKDWCPPRTLKGGRWDMAFSKSDLTLHFECGSWVQFKTYMQDPATHGGISLHRIRFDEEPPYAIYNENRVRVLDRDGDILIGMTPVQGLTWMYDRFWTPYERGELANSFVQTVNMDDNPVLSPDAIEAALAEYTAEEREARKTGRFIHFHGLIYPQFGPQCIIPHERALDAIYGDDPLLHYEAPALVPIYSGVDPGIGAMAAAVLVAHTPDDELIVFEEVALPKDVAPTAKDVATAVQLIQTKYGVKPAWNVIDPSARNKNHATGRSLQLEYSDAGLVTFAGQNDVRAGINAVRLRLAHRKLLVADNCTETIAEFRKYRWKAPSHTSPEDPQEVPIKKDDHLLDALRYLVMARPYRPELLRYEGPVDPFTQAALDEMSGRRKPALPAHFY